MGVKQWVRTLLALGVSTVAYHEAVAQQVTPPGGCPAKCRCGKTVNCIYFSMSYAGKQIHQNKLIPLDKSRDAIDELQKLQSMVPQKATEK